MAAWIELGNGARLQSGGFLSDLGVGGSFYGCVLRSRVSAAGEGFKSSLRSVGIVPCGSPAFVTSVLADGTYEDRFVFRVGSESDVLTVKRWITTAAVFAAPYDIHIVGAGTPQAGESNSSLANSFLNLLPGSGAATGGSASDESWFTRFTDTAQTIAKTPLYLAILGAVMIVGYLLWTRGK